MKTFDCSKCQNKQNGFMHCLFYQNEPQLDVCSGYQKIYDDMAYNQDKVQNLIKRRAIELINKYQGISSDYNCAAWSKAIEHSIQRFGVDTNNLPLIARFIRSFGMDSLFFACDDCGNIVELADDSQPHCPACGHTSFVYIAT